MRRSEINKIMQDALDFMKGMKYNAPPFVYWTPKDWENKSSEYDEVRDCMLGWDITDFGSGDYHNCGLLMITMRNGVKQSDTYFKPYAEKVLIVEEGQVTPFHFHWSKMEDIINRGGGNLMVQLYNRTDDEKLADTPVLAMVDGRRFMVPAGTTLTIGPGESITLPPGQYHKFWAEGGRLFIVEVSSVNEDNTDNRFLDAPARFPEIEEDEEPLHLMFNEYPVAE